MDGEFGLFGIDGRLMRRGKGDSLQDITKS
jgi:hypothetical protein